MLSLLDPQHTGSALRINQDPAQVRDYPSCSSCPDYVPRARRSVRVARSVQEGNLIPNIDLAWDEIAYFQIGDNPGRDEPTTGEINFENEFRHIRDKGFRGVMGMEHGNSRPGRVGERAVIDAYRSVDPVSP